MAKYVVFCNECGSKKETDCKKDYEFCPECGHCNTGCSTKENYLKGNNLEGGDKGEGIGC